MNQDKSRRCGELIEQQESSEQEVLMVRTLVVVIGLLLESGEVMCVPVCGPLCSGA